MVTTRVTREFAAAVERLEDTKRERVSAVVTDLSVILALQTDRDALDRVGEYILRRPVRVAAVAAERCDPVLLSALAGDRALRNLGGLDAKGTDGEKLEYITTLEVLAARSARDYVQLCQTDPAEARAQAARWAANRSGVRSSFLREGIEAAESTYGVACDAIIDRSSNRRPLVAPPPGWQPQGVMADVAKAFPPAFHNRLGDVPLVSRPPERWVPTQGDGYKGWDVVRNRLIAKGGIGRAEQLARRSFIRVPLTRLYMRAQFRANLARGPEATQQFLKRVASNPRRAATLLTMNVDPMVVAAALGPQAMQAVMQGQQVPESSSLGRLCDAMVRHDRARVNDVRRDGDGPAADRLRAYRVDTELGRDAEEFVNKAWDGTESAERGLGDGPLAIDRESPDAFYHVWQELRTGEIRPAGLPDPVVDRMREIREGDYEVAPKGWADISEDYSDQRRARDEERDEDSSDRRGSDEEPHRDAPDVPDQSREPEQAVPVSQRLAEPAADRPDTNPRSAGGRAEAEAFYAEHHGHFGEVPVQTVAVDAVAGSVGSIEPGQEGKFVVFEGSPDGDVSWKQWKAYGDPEVDTVVKQDDGTYEVTFHRGAVASPEAATWAAAQVDNRLRMVGIDQEGHAQGFDSDLAYEQVAAYKASLPDRSGPEPDRVPDPDRADAVDLAQLDPDRPPVSVHSAAELAASAQVMPDATNIRSEQLTSVEVASGHEGRFTYAGGNGMPDMWQCHGDPEIWAVVVQPDGSYDVIPHGGVGVVSQEALVWAASEVQARRTPDFDRALASDQADAFLAAQQAQKYPDGEPVLEQPASPVLDGGPSTPTSPETPEAEVLGSRDPVPEGSTSPDQSVPDPAESIEGADRLDRLYRDPSLDAPNYEVAEPGSPQDKRDDQLPNETLSSYHLDIPNEMLTAPGSPQDKRDDQLPNETLSSYHLDIPNELLTAPRNRQTLRTGEAPSVDAAMPEAPEFRSAGNGRWDVVGDPQVSHLTELADGGYRVHFHPGVEPARENAVLMAEHAHERSLDQGAADRDQTLDEKAVSETLSKTLGRQAVDGHAPCDDSRPHGGGSDPVLVANYSDRPGRPEPLVQLSGQAVRAWMRDQNPEAYKPEFVTKRDLDEAGGQLKPGASGVDVVRYFARDVQPFGKDGKLDLHADPVTVYASEKVKVYHVSSQVSSDPPGVKEKFVRDSARNVQAPGVDVRQVAAATGIKVVDEAKKPLGYSDKDKTINVSSERAKDSLLNDAKLNGKVLYAAAEAQAAKNNVKPGEAKLVAYLAAERMASRLRVSYTPVALDQKQRKALVVALKDPSSMHRLVKQADSLGRKLVNTAVHKDREREQDRGPQPQRPSTPRPSKDRSGDEKGHGR